MPAPSRSASTPPSNLAVELFGSSLAGELFGPPPAPAGRRAPAHRASTRRPSKPLRALLDGLIAAACATGIAVVVNTFVMQTFMIPSESMESTLRVGDRVMVSRLTPAVFDVRRGDVVVFTDSGHWMDQPGVERPDTPQPLAYRVLSLVGMPMGNTDYMIKRVIGIGGDTVSADATGVVSVNGVPVTETYLDDGKVGSAVPFTTQVPADSLWVMGDNRDHSADSRFNTDDGNGGAVPMDQVFGVAFVKVFPFTDFQTMTNPDDVFGAVPPP